MQGIDKIIEKILKDAEADAQQTAKQTQKQVAEMRAKHEAETDKQIDEMKADYAQKREQLKTRSATMADLEERRNKLAIKRELVEEAFAKAEGDLLKLSEGEYLDFIEKLMRNLDEMRGDIIIGKNEKRITADFVDSVNSKLDSAYSLASDKGNFEGGFVLRNGKVETNCTVSMLVSQAKRGLEQKVAAALFDESGA